MNNIIHSVLVTYNTPIEILHKTIASVCGQVDQLIVVDNGSKNIQSITDVARSYGAELVALPVNKGIAYAQNIGIQKAIQQGCHYILLMDHDTIMADGCVQYLCHEYEQIKKNNTKIGSLCCAYQNTHDNMVSAVWYTQGIMLCKKQVDYTQQKLFEVDFTVASGSLLSVEALKDVGLMDERLFIDLVDVEWGLRANYLGYKNFQSFEYIMQHTLGDKKIKTPFGFVTLHSPERDYYYIRNSILISRTKVIKASWFIFFIKRIFIFLIVFSLFGDHKLRRLRLMLDGVRDGLAGRGGPLPR